MLSNAIALQQYQFVTEEERIEWELYAKENEQWVQDAIEVERLDTTFTAKTIIPDYNGTNNFSTSIRYNDSPVEYNYTGPYYTPSWQTYPMLPSDGVTAYNFNAIQHKLLGPGIKRVRETKKVVVGPVVNFEDSNEEGGRNTLRLWAARHVPEGVDASEPIIQVLYPILNTAPNGGTTHIEPNSTVVGILSSTIYWHSYLKNILPLGERGLVAVFANTCNQSFTYEINGHEAKWLGPDDLHDTQFDYLKQTLTFEEIGLHSSLIGQYGGLPIDHEHCMYTVSTYPSQTMKDMHHTNNPIILTVIACAIFIFTAVTFLGYDKIVAMRYVPIAISTSFYAFH